MDENDSKKPLEEGVLENRYKQLGTRFLSEIKVTRTQEQNYAGLEGIRGDCKITP